jgi:hypothetical protein
VARILLVIEPQYKPFTFFTQRESTCLSQIQEKFWLVLSLLVNFDNISTTLENSLCTFAEITIGSSSLPPFSPSVQRI